MRTSFQVLSRARNCFCNLTSEVRAAVRASGVQEGICVLFVPHTTCGLTLCENADPDVRRDVLFAMNRAVPNVDFHHAEGNSDAHTKASLFGFSLTLMIEEGDVLLGRWQDVFLVEFDGPRKRTVYLKIMAG